MSGSSAKSSNVEWNWQSNHCENVSKDLKGPQRRPHRPIAPPAIELVLKNRPEDRLQGVTLLLAIGTFRYQVDRGFKSEVRERQRGARRVSRMEPLQKREFRPHDD